MSTITTRAGKGSTLTFTELDNNFKKAATAKTADYTIAESDNRDTVEFDGSSLTATLPTASTVTTSADTGDFEVTIKNLNSSDLTVSRASTDTIDGATSLTLVQYESVTLKVNNGADGWNIVARYSYDEGSFTATFHGFSFSPTATFYYTRIGNAVILQITATTGTASGTTFTITGLPAGITPATPKYFLGRIEDNSAYAVGLISVGSSGTMTVYPDMSLSSWTNNGSKGIPTTLSISYTLN